jgi:hypothetical protein
MAPRTKILMLILAGLCALSHRSLAQVSGPPVPANVPPPKSQPAQPMTDQMTNIPYFTLRDGMSSVLTLNNLASTPTKVSVTLYNMEGKAHPLDPITVDPHSYKQVDLSAVVPGEDFNAGNIMVAYNGIQMALTCQVTVTSVDKRISFESREPYEMQAMQEMMPFMSTKLAGIVSLPRAGANAFLALTNVGVNQSSVQVSVGSEQKSITIYPRQTRLLRLNEDFSQRGPGAALVRAQYDGVPGDIITSGFVLDLENGYSSAFTMVDPSLARSSHLAGAHLRVGEPDASEGFPKGTYFRSPLVLGNLGDKPVTAHIAVDYTVRQPLEMTPVDASQASATEDTFATISAGNVTIPPGSVQRIELSDALSKAVKDPIIEAGVDVDYDGAHGTVIGYLVSLDQTGDYSFEVPIKDPASMTAGMESIYPWTLEGGTKTVVHIKNTTNQPESGDLTFNYEDGGVAKTYRHPRIDLQPYQTVAVDIHELQISKKPDALGQIFSPNAKHGQAAWHQETPYTLIGRAEQTDVAAGIASSFSCETICCDNYTRDGILEPSNLTGNVGGNGWLYSYLVGTDCYGNPFGPSSTTASWWSDSSSIASVSPTSGTSTDVTYQGGGSTYITGTVGYRYYAYNGADCACIMFSGGTASPGATVDAKPTVSIQGNPTHVYIGQDPTVVQINGLFSQGNPSGGTYQWSSPDTSISFDNPTAQDVHVTATSYSGGINDTKIAVSYTQGGQANSASVMLTKLIFEFLARDSVIEISAYNGPNTYGYLFNAQYNVFANPGGQQVTNAGGVRVTESVTLQSSNVSFNPNFSHGALNASSQIVDSLGLANNTALPANLSIVDSQDLFVGGIYVRNNTLSFTASGVTVKNNGPYN